MGLALDASSFNDKNRRRVAGGVSGAPPLGSLPEDGTGGGDDLVMEDADDDMGVNGGGGGEDGGSGTADGADGSAFPAASPTARSSTPANATTPTAAGAAASAGKSGRRPNPNASPRKPRQNGATESDDPVPGRPSGWTDEERRLFFDGLEKFGKEWPAIAVHIGGMKTAEQCKNFYNNNKRRRKGGSGADHANTALAAHLKQTEAMAVVAQSLPPLPPSPGAAALPLPAASPDVNARPQRTIKKRERDLNGADDRTGASTPDATTKRVKIEVAPPTAAAAGGKTAPAGGLPLPVKSPVATPRTPTAGAAAPPRVHITFSGADGGANSSSPNLGVDKPKLARKTSKEPGLALLTVNSPLAKGLPSPAAVRPLSGGVHVSPKQPPRIPLPVSAQSALQSAVAAGKSLHCL